jgi:hypothetical protein
MPSTLDATVVTLDEAAPRRADRRALALYAGAAVAYGLARLGSFTGIPSRVSDTPGYERTAHAAIFSWRFFAGERPFTVPLLYRAVGGDHGRIVAQLVFSTVCWLVLAWAVSRSLKWQRMRPWAALLVLLFSLTAPVIMWDTVLLSESVTISLFALAVALALLVVQRPTWWLVGGFVATIGLWVFARDSNAYVAACVAVAAALMAIRPGFRREKAAVALGCLAFAGAGYASANHGGRWWAPMWDVWTQRIEPSPQKKAYFAARAHGKNWFDDQARTIYADYLLSHPAYALTQPFHGTQKLSVSSTSNLASVLAPDLTAYNDNAVHRVAPLPTSVGRIIWLDGAVLVLAALGVVLLAAFHLARGRNPAWIVPLVLIVTTYPASLVAWHMSGQEVDRHAIGGALGLRFGILLLALLLVDALRSSSVAPDERSVASGRVGPPDDGGRGSEADEPAPRGGAGEAPDGAGDGQPSGEPAEG